MRAASPLWLGALGALALAGCGDPAVDGGYLGEPLFTLQGWVSVDYIDPSDRQRFERGQLRSAVLWGRPSTDDATFDLVTSVEQSLTSDGTFPARYTLALYDPPPESLLVAAPGGGGEYAFGVIINYLDANDDGRWDRGRERLVGGAIGSVVVFTPEGASAPLFGSLTPGYHRLVFDPFNSCARGDGVFTLIRDPSPDTDLFVGMDFPVGLLADFNCDGGAFEWVSACPYFDTVHLFCRGEVIAPEDAEMCGLCEPFLSPEGGTDESCRAWFETCPNFEILSECQAELERCLPR